ncbi:MAG: conjugal transfer protein TraH [Betaproteobacteria bacterium]
MPTRLPRLRSLAAAVTVCFYTASANAMTMQELFDSVNAAGNVSSPAVVQGQTLNMYTGGSMFMRMPKRTYNVASFTPPSWDAGCGGIDLFLGGFSFINKEQFVSMLRNIGTNALGYGFKLAIQNLCPTCDNVMQALEATARFMNQMNVNSCETAVGLVNAVKPDSWKRDVQNTAKNYGVGLGSFADVTDAWTKVANDWGKAGDELEKIPDAKPEVKEALPVGNVVWIALKKIDGLTDEYRMLLMSMIGTTVFPKPGDSGAPKPYPRKEITVQALIGGNVVDADGKPVGKIELPIWKCSETTDCSTMTEDVLKVDSFRTMVRTKLDSIIDKIAGREAYADSAEVMKFLNVTDIPVYKMIAVATSLNNTGIADNLLNRYQELLAAKYAEVYIQRAVSDLRAAFAKYSAQASTSLGRELDELKPELNVIETQARQVLATAYTQTISTYNIALEVAHMERALNANLSQTLRSSLTYGKSLGR